MENEVGRNRRKVQDLARGLSVFGKRQMVRWAVRWAIGFSLIGIVVHFRPQWSWLWWVATGFAALVPLVTLTGQWVVGRKGRSAENALDDLEEAAREAGGD